MHLSIKASFVAAMLFASAASADTGVTPGTIPNNTWVNLQVDRCVQWPWSPHNNNRVVLVVYPVPFDPARYLWTTDDATIATFTVPCWYQHTGIWVYSPNGVGWLFSTDPIQ